MQDGRSLLVLVILIVALCNKLAADESLTASPGMPQSPEPSVAKPVITAAEVIEEWETLGASPEWAATFPWSPKNSESRLELAHFYLAVGKVPRAETLLREQIGRLTEPYATGVSRPSLYQLLKLEADVCRAKNDVAGEVLYRNVASFIYCREIEASLVGKVLFVEEYKRRREQQTPNESVDAFLLAVLEAVEKRVPEAWQVANHAEWNADIENYVNSGVPERARDKIVLNSAYRSLAILYAATGRIDKALQIIDAHVVDKNTGFRGPELFYERMLDAMSRHGQSRAVAKYLDVWFQSDDEQQPVNNRNYVRRYLVAALAKSGDLEAARKAAGNAFLGEQYLVLALLDMGREAEAWAVVTSMKRDHDKFGLFSEVLGRFDKQPISPEKEAEFPMVVKVTLEETKTLRIIYAAQVLEGLSSLIYKMEIPAEQCRLLSPLFRDALKDAIGRSDFSANGHDGDGIMRLARVCAQLGFADLVVKVESRAAEGGTTSQPPGAQKPIAICHWMDRDILEGLSCAGQFKEAIALYESWPEDRRTRLASRIVVCYLCAGDDDKADAIVKDELKEAAKDLYTIAYIAIDVARQGQFDKAVAFFTKWGAASDASLRAKRINEMRNAAVRYHLKQGDVHRALDYARQITSKQSTIHNTKQSAYYAIIQKLLRQEVREKRQTSTQVQHHAHSVLNSIWDAREISYAATVPSPTSHGCKVAARPPLASASRGMLVE